MLFQISLIATVVAAYFAKEWYQFSNPDCEISGRSLGKRDRFWKPIVKVLQLGNVDEQRIRAKELEKGKRRTTVDEMKTCRKEHETHQHNINYMIFSAVVAVVFAIAGFARASRRDTQSYAEDEMTLDGGEKASLEQAYRECQNSSTDLTVSSSNFTNLVELCSNFINTQSNSSNKYKGIMKCAGMLHHLQNAMRDVKEGQHQINRLFLREHLLNAIFNHCQHDRNTTLVLIADSVEFRLGLRDTTDDVQNSILAAQIIACPQLDNRNAIDNVVRDVLKPKWFERISRDRYDYGPFVELMNFLKSPSHNNSPSTIWNNLIGDILDDLAPWLGIVHRIGQLRRNTNFVKYDTNSHDIVHELCQDSLNTETDNNDFVLAIKNFIKSFIDDSLFKIGQNHVGVESPGAASPIETTRRMADSILSSTGGHDLTTENVQIHNEGNGHQPDSMSQASSSPGGGEQFQWDASPENDRRRANS